MTNPPKSILFCVLNWGLGHATRSVPIIQKLLQLNTKIIIASDGAALRFLQEEFPDLQFEELPSYGIQYPKNGNMIASMAKQAPYLLSVIAKERKAIQILYQKHRFNCIISDNRYGCFDKRTKSIFITHQLHLQVPKNVRLLSYFLNRFNHKLIKNFDECWIPDMPEEKNLSGKLSHPALPKCRYIGLLSRFEKINDDKKKYKVFTLLSGPEPQRSIFQNIVLQQLEAADFTSILCAGTKEREIFSTSKNVEATSFMQQETIAKTMAESKFLICRSGYSTIMDLVKMQANIKVIFVPTPGQTEQEYLAKKFAADNLCINISQKKFSLSDALKRAEFLDIFSAENYILESSTLLSQALTSVITS